MSPQTTDQRAQLRAVLDALDCGAVLLSRAGQIVAANRALCGMLERSPEELAGRDFRTLCPDPDARAIVDRALQQTDAERTEAALRRADGQRVPVLLSARPFGHEPPLDDHRLITVLDLAEQKAAEEAWHTQYQAVARLSDTVLEQALVLKRYNRKLEARVRERTRELHQANMEAIVMLAVAGEAKDPDTGAHVRRIQRYSLALARRLGLSEAEAEQIGYSAILHDVGKMQIPDKLLQKPGPLTPEERTVMETHVLAGERILSPATFFDLARQIARSHHENWDGSGYPDRVPGPGIPLAARIVRLADVFDALVTRRVYKPAWPRQQAAQSIRDNAGKLFDAEIVQAFLSLLADGTVDTIAPVAGAAT